MIYRYVFIPHIAGDWSFVIVILWPWDRFAGCPFAVFAVGSRIESSRSWAHLHRLDYMKSLITMEEEKAEVIDSRALPLELRPFKSVFNPVLGQQLETKSLKEPSEMKTVMKFEQSKFS